MTNSKLQITNYKSLLIKNGDIVLQDKIVKGDLFVSGGKIAKIGGSITDTADKVIDAAGLTVMAGFVDMHCHLREPGFEYKEDIASGTAAAVAGGFTSVACMPNTSPVIDNAALVTYIKNKAAEVGKCKVYPIGAITKGQEGKELAEMGKMKLAGAVAASDDGRPVSCGNVMKQALLYAKGQGLPIISHCEDLGIAGSGVANDGYNSFKAGLRGISRAAEEAMVARDITLASAYNAPVHIAHVSTAGSVDLIRYAKAKGVAVTCETCPHYFSATDDEILNYNTNAKINPPLRTKDDVEAIIAGLKDGTIDAIATDHAPHSSEEKKREFDAAPFGSVGLETSFAVSYTYLVNKKHITLNQLSRLMSAAPAQILRVGKGVVAEGEPADLTVIDLNSKYKADSAKFTGKGKNSVFDGRALKGKIIKTIVDGQIKYDN